ncbi:DNA gyrase subunit A, partial [Candidatus Parvarchaeota archaeon]|nr:DNA gyrase subunit A [Candidatus Parvarchaeota archaeon]
DKIIDGITNVQDRSDKAGLEIEVEIRKDANPELILNQLYAHSQLEDSFGIINLALVGAGPKVLSLRQMLDEFIRHRQTVTRNRCVFELQVANDRSHILEGLKVALSNIDSIIKAIKASPNTLAAKQTLMSGYNLSEKQAVAILDMKLSRLTALEQDKIDSEHKELQQTISNLNKILSDENEILKIISEEMDDIKAKYATPRKTQIMQDDGQIQDEDLIQRETVAIIITESDYIKRIPIAEYRSQKRGGRGVIGTETKEDDKIKDLIIANTHDYMLFFTNQGEVHWLKVYQIPQSSRYAMGKAIINLLEIKEEKISATIPISKFKEDEFLVMATSKGIVKRSSLMEYSRPRRGGIRAITLKENDTLIGAMKTDGKRTIILGSKHGMAIRFDENEIREIGRTGQGVIGMRLEEGDEVIGMALDTYPTLLTVTENGFGKRTSLDEYRGQGRGGKGVITIKTEGRNGNVVSILTVSEEQEIIMLSSGGKAIRSPVKDISVIGRNTQGVRLMRLDEGEKLTAVERILNGNGTHAGGEVETAGKDPKPEDQNPQVQSMGQDTPPTNSPAPKRDNIIIA